MGQPPVAQQEKPVFNLEQQREKKAAILDAVINLIKTAAIKPGGENFKQAIEKLNDYFEGTPPSEYALSPAARKYLLSQQTLGRTWTDQQIQTLESPEFTLRDARHVEDCMLYYGIATRVGGTGDDLARVRRVFDWTVRHVELVPPGALKIADRQLEQAAVRPYDVLVRGMATEDGSLWAERGWVFISLCRQLGIDAGLLTYTPRSQGGTAVWVCGVLIDGKVYLFDTRIGLSIPGPDGNGVATLDQVMADPRLLERLDLPGQSSYGATRSELQSSPSKIGVLIDSSTGYISPRMQLLQRDLRGRNRTILFRDPAEQNEQFAKALGKHFGGTKLWDLPIMVQTLLFTSPQFAEATQRALSFFTPALPLLHARVMHLRGETAGAIEEYVKFRFAENLVKADALKKQVSPEEQRALDAYATYFLALANLDQNNPAQAEFFFKETLRLLPEVGPKQPFYAMFRWGAESNLGLLNEAKGDLVQATAYYSEPVPMPQLHGNLLRARDLVWRNPLAPVAPAVSPARK